MLRALRRQCVREVSTLLLFTSLLLQSATAVAPGWWDTQQVLTSGAVADDYTVANIGQLKNVAKKAAAEMNSALTGGAGNDINSLIAAWNAAQDANVTRDDYAALTIGQLKRVVRLFYDRLAEAGVTPTGTYPWSGRNADDYALANLGQLKTVFSFEMDTGDANQNGIPDVWELQMFGNLNQIAGGDFDQDGLTNLIEYQTGTDPANTDTDGDGVSDGDEVAQGTDPAKPPPSWKWTQAQLAEAEAAYEIGLQQRRREVNTVVQPSGGGPNPEDAVTYAYQTYLDDDLEHEIWTGSCTTNELGTATELANGAKAAHPKVDLATLKEWGPISPSGGTGVAELTSSGGVEAYATIERGVGTAKAEFRLVRRLKAGATAPEDSDRNPIKPEIKRTFLKVTTIATDTGTTTTTAEALEFTIIEGADISKNTSGKLFPDLTTAGTRRIKLVPMEFKEHASESGFDNFARATKQSSEQIQTAKLERPWLMVPADEDRPAKVDLHGAGNTKLKLEIKDGTQTMTPQETGSLDPLVVTIQGSGQSDKANVQVAQVRLLDLVAYEKKTLDVAIWTITLINDDLETSIKIGEGKPNTVCIRAKGNILYTDPEPGDLKVGNTITTGPDGICQTTAHYKDEQVIQVGKGEQNATIIEPGPNGLRNTVPSGNDAVSGQTLTTGPDGIRETAKPKPKISPVGVPTKEQLKQYLDEIYGKQMNVYFNIVEGAVDIAYDVQSGEDDMTTPAVGNPRLHPGTGINGMFDFFYIYSPSTEEKLLIKNACNKGVHVNVYYFGTPINDCNRETSNSNSNIYGKSRELDNSELCYISTSGSYVSGDTEINLSLSLEEVMWTTAHEIGHAGALKHPRVLKLGPDGKLVDRGPYGVALATLDEDQKRLMMGPPSFAINPKTQRIHALLIKPEWDTFRKRWGW